MKTILMLVLGLVGCATSVEPEPPTPAEECDCDVDAADLADECVAECYEEPESNEGAACVRESDCTEGLWCVITPETGPTEGFCKQVH